MENKLKIGVVNFRTRWGDKEANLRNIQRIIGEAAEQGVQLLLFPEMCVTGYDDVKETPKPEKMQTRLAEAVPGPTSRILCQAAEKAGIYCIVGMPELGEDGNVYNAQLVISPDGTTETYRKIHLPPPEPRWASNGNKPFIFDSPWGPIGCAICYDVYTFPEITRYLAAKGCRLILNSTAYARVHGMFVGPRAIEALVVTNGIFIASANLCGMDLSNEFLGGSNVVGPTDKNGELEYVCGVSFADPKAQEYELATAELDLSRARRMQYTANPKTGKCDFNPALYVEMYKELIR